MDASLQSRAEQPASEIAGLATTTGVVTGLMRLLLKSAMDRNLHTETATHLRSSRATMLPWRPDPSRPTAKGTYRPR